MNKTYIVKEGDSLYTIGKKYNVTPKDIIKANKLVSTMIYPIEPLMT